jgi:glycosyltransferase involved in cell wall biosynthesis
LRVTAVPHVSICVCTFKRSALLASLLSHLESQRTDGLFTVEIVIVDNDAGRTAERAVRDYAERSRLHVTYAAEPEQNIALARNRAVAEATGSLLAFIDDDEIPAPDWLYLLFRARAKYGVDGVLGPVVSEFQESPPQWVTKGKFFDRMSRPTGEVVSWPEARTGNVLVARDSLRDLDPPFRPEFGSGGEDMDFFRRLQERGRTFVWCDEAVAHEVVPSHRCTRRFLIRRAVLRGSNFPKQGGRGHRLKHTLKSVVAVPCYVVALPALAILGQHHFMAYVVKLADHGSRLLAMMGVRLMTERET